MSSTLMMMLPSAQTVGALVLGLILLFVALSAYNAILPRHHQACWRWSERLCVVGVAIAALMCISLNLIPTAKDGLTALSVRIDGLTTLMLGLASFLGWIVTRYSARYLEGDAKTVKYLSWLLLALGAIVLLVTTDSLPILLAAWAWLGIALHQLLSHYADRPAALLAAHKKFVISRIADVCAIATLFYLFPVAPSMSITNILQASSVSSLVHPDEFASPLSMAAVMCAFIAILRSAQVPFHGWLLQVMEAPTPVSALLHAGIVNIGGYFLLRNAPLIDGSLAAQLLLVGAGTLTAVCAAFVMMTRISVKVMLAWSTCAQMGFMLIEIGLGLYSLAALHLVAHSLYKAYAFLSAGTVASSTTTLRRISTGTQLSVPRLFGLSVICAALVYAWSQFSGHLGWNASSMLPWMVWVGTAMPALCTSRGERLIDWFDRRFVIGCLAMLASYVVLHGAFAIVVPDAPRAVSGSLWIFPVAALLLQSGLQSVVLAYPDSNVSKYLYPKAFTGFHLDELFTFVSLRVWPIRRPARSNNQNGVQV